MLALAAVLNAVFYCGNKSMASFAIATLFTNIIWLIICEMQSKSIRYGKNVCASIVILLVVYMITGYKLNSILGCVIYIVTGILVGVTLMKESFLFVIESLIGTVKSKLNKVK